jgi:hypothetical protein
MRHNTEWTCQGGLGSVPGSGWLPARAMMRPGRYPSAAGLRLVRRDAGAVSRVS